MTLKILASLLLLAVSVLFNVKLFIEYRESAALLEKCEEKYEAMLKTKYRGSESIEKARVDALVAEHRADLQLITPPVIAGDDCGSARIRIDSWLEERKKE